MPAILRNSLPNLYPLIAIIRPYAQNEANAVSGGSDPTVPDGRTEPAVWNTRPCLTARPSGPPDCVSTVTTMSSILARFFGCFGLVVAAGNTW